jgi:hypothetical protein
MGRGVERRGEERRGEERKKGGRERRIGKKEESKESKRAGVTKCVD